MRHPTSRVSAMAQTRHRTSFYGPRVARIVDMLEVDDVTGALRSLIIPSTPRIRIPGVSGLLQVCGQQRVAKVLEGAVGVLAFPVWKQITAKRVLANEDTTTAADILQRYYGGTYSNEMLNYFLFRFGQPRHLAALELLTLFQHESGPIVDIACGIGHLTHYLTSACASPLVVGLDRNFVQLLVAKRFVAPGAEFVCCEADKPLPFRTNAFAGGVCSDAFHYFQRTIGCVREMERVIESRGAKVVTRVANALVEPHEGYELTPDGYRSLFTDGQSAIVDERTLMSRYLSKLGPNLARTPPSQELREAKWLSIVVSSSQELFREYGVMDHWPHATGRLRINPLYQEQAPDELGNRDMTFQFPSKWYEIEDCAYREYAPASITICSKDMEHIEQGQYSEALDELIRQCVLVGMPERYM